LSAAARPRIGLLHYTCPPVIGGVETIVLEHARRLAARAYPVSVIAGRGGPLPAESVELTLIPEIDSRHAPTPADQILARLEPHLKRLDVLIAHNVLTLHFNLGLSDALWRVAERRQPALVSWVHDLSWTNPLYLPLLEPRPPFTLLRQYHPGIATVCVSRARLEEWLRISGAPAASARVIPNGVDPVAVLGLNPLTQSLTERFGFLDVDALLLAPVRITRRKNLEWAIEAAARVRDAGRSVRLVISGPPGPHSPDSQRYLDELKQLRGRLRLDADVVFLFEAVPAAAGAYPIDAATLRNLYMLSDVVVLPSSSEGFGLPLAEAALLKTPVVCTDLPAFLEVGGDGVRFVRQDDGASGFAEAIAEVLDGATARLRRRVLSNLAWDRILSRDLEPLLQSLHA
jgi:mannosylglucosylglycerate synthase